MTSPLVLPELDEMIASRNHEALRVFCSTGQPVIVAECVSNLDPKQAWEVLRHAPPEIRAEIFSHLEEDFEVQIIKNLSRMEIARLLTDMPADDRADLFNLIPEELAEAVLPGMAQAEREDIRRLAAYEEGTAGSVMTSDYATLPTGLSAHQAIERLREIAPDRETIYHAYILDEQRKLLGFVSLKDLIVARRDARIDDIMHRDIIYAYVDEDQEKAARRMQKYDLMVMPVLNRDNALVGIITYDDALDVIVQEQTEDIEKLMAISGSHDSAVYMKTSVLTHFKNRAVWLVALAILGLVSGYIVQGFEDVLQTLIILTAFMPMLADTGGNTGSQAATLVVRALALGEVAPRDIFRVLFKELRIALMLAFLLGILAFGRVALIGAGSTPPEHHSLYMVGFAIATALGLQVVTATLVGATLPLAVARCNRDPAVIASPALTTIVDITGLLIYFSVVKFMLGL